MSEHVDGTADGDPRTGNPQVDAVLDSLTGLDDLPVGEHPAAYERIHDALRAVLSHAGEDDGTATEPTDPGVAEAP